MSKKIGIIGDGNSAGLIAQAKRGNSLPMVVIDNSQPEDSFDLNGVVYAPIKTEKIKYQQVQSKLGAVISAMSWVYMPYMIDMVNMYSKNKYSRQLPENTDIIKEYGLIQQKQSKLTKWERDMVVAIFEKTFYKVSK